MQQYIAVFLTLLVWHTSCFAESLPPLGIGYLGLPQKVTTQELAPGLKFIHVVRGKLSQHDYYTLSSGAISSEKADELARQLTELGHEPRFEALAEFGVHGEELGVCVRIGRFSERDEADALAERLAKSGLSLSTRFTAEDGNASSGPFDISILKMDLNAYQGEILSVLGKDTVSGKEKTSAMAARYQALAAINAGFFSWSTEVGTDGDPAGISVIDGELVSEATDGRAALVIQNGTSPSLWVAHDVRTQIDLQIADTKWVVNGLNRDIGKILNCGNQAAQPTKLPAHDFVCTNDNELVVFDQHFGAAPDGGDGFGFVVGADGKVSSITNKLGGAIPRQGFLVQAIGSTAKRLSHAVHSGGSATISKKILSEEGEIALTDGLYIVNGGPTLLRAGQIDFDARFREGWETHFAAQGITDEFVDKKDKATVGDGYSSGREGFYNGWVVRRHPRTAVGLTADNVAYFVVVYGRQPGISAGASVTEMATILQSLGATEAFNLDGGGSTAMVVGDKLTGPPSDKEGERPVGDTLVFTPGKSSTHSE